MNGLNCFKILRKIRAIEGRAAEETKKAPAEADAQLLFICRNACYLFFQQFRRNFLIFEKIFPVMVADFPQHPAGVAHGNHI